MLRPHGTVCHGAFLLLVCGKFVLVVIKVEPERLVFEGGSVGEGTHKEFLDLKWFGKLNDFRLLQYVLFDVFIKLLWVL